MINSFKPAKRHPREEQAAWLKILLSEQLTSARDLYLYGSTSKISGFQAEDLTNFDESSDYDFAVQDTKITHDQLISLGWQKKDELSYQDAQTVHIFEGRVDGERVQVSLRQDLPRFKEAWTSINYEFYWRFLNKRSPTFIGREGVKAYLDQLFWLLQGAYHEGLTRNITKTSSLGIGPAWVRAVLGAELVQIEPARGEAF
jgi:hypothetical protein